MEMLVILQNPVKQEKTKTVSLNLWFSVAVVTNESWLAMFYGKYHLHETIRHSHENNQYVRKLTMHCKCQPDHLIPFKCVCGKPTLRVLEKSQRGTNEILSRL